VGCFLKSLHGVLHFEVVSKNPSRFVEEFWSQMTCTSGRVRMKNWAVLGMWAQ